MRHAGFYTLNLFILFCTEVSLKELGENLMLSVTEPLPSYATDILLQRLGIAQWMEETPCSRQSALYFPSTSGWKNCMS